MTKAKQPYETTFIVNASLEDAQIDIVVNNIQELITRHGGEISAVNRWGRKRLAYTIKKKNNGYYANIEFESPATVLSELERTYILDENILRFITIKLDKRALKARTESAHVVLQPETEAPILSPLIREPLFGNEGSEIAPGIE